MLTPDEFVARLIELPVGLSFPEIANEVGMLARDLRPVVDQGVADGALEWFEAAGGETVVLTPLEASRRDVEPTWVSDTRMIWRPFGWEPPKNRGHRREGLAPEDAMAKAVAFEDAGRIASRDDGPVALAIAVEEGPGLVAEALTDGPASKGRRGAFARLVPASRFPWPRRFLGSTSRWDGPTRKGTCPVCRGRRLEFLEYCLACDRSGIDHIVGRVRVVPDPRPARDRLAEKATRKERRRAMAKLEKMATRRRMAG